MASATEAEVAGGMEEHVAVCQGPLSHSPLPAVCHRLGLRKQLQPLEESLGHSSRAIFFSG